MEKESKAYKHEMITETLVNEGVSAENASKAAWVLVNDNPDLPNLGRNTQDQEDVRKALLEMQKNEG